MGLSKEAPLTSLRRMFYLVTPNETSFKDVNEVPKYIEEASEYFFLFVFLELIVSVLRQDGKFRLHDAVTSVSAGMFSRIPMMLFRTIHLTSYSWVYDHFLVYELPWDSPWTWLLCFLLVDMGYYWFHRFAHEVNFMWAAHQVHHSSEDYNFSTALRQSIMQNYTSWVFYLPLALFIPPSVFMVHNELNILYQFWIHTQYIKSLGPLEYILNTPSHHRVHHGRNPYCIDKNYAGTLIIWDRMFGTFQAEGEEVAYGLTHPLGSFEAIFVQFGYLQYMWGRLKELRGLGNKIQFIFSGPGWSPGTPRLGNPEDIPEVEKPVKRFDTKVPMWMNVYVAVHFGIVNLSFLQFIAHKEGLTQTAVIGYLALVLFSLSCFGRIFDQQASGPYLELLRCLVCLGTDHMLSRAGYHDNTDLRVVLSLRAIFGLSAGLWALQVARGAGAPAVAKKAQ